jgi:hypothetical protein
MIEISRDEIMRSHKVTSIIPVNKDRNREIYRGAYKYMEYMTSISEWLGLIYQWNI